MVSLTKLSQVPKKTEVFVFGSILTSNDPRDLDIVIVYENSFFIQSAIFDHCSEFVNELNELYNLKIDVTYLSRDESSQTTFIDRVKAIPLSRFLEMQNVFIS